MGLIQEHREKAFELWWQASGIPTRKENHLVSPIFFFLPGWVVQAHEFLPVNMHLICYQSAVVCDGVCVLGCPSALSVHASEQCVCLYLCACAVCMCVYGVSFVVHLISLAHSTLQGQRVWKVQGGV